MKFGDRILFLVDAFPCEFSQNIFEIGWIYPSWPHCDPERLTRKEYSLSMMLLDGFRTNHTAERLTKNIVLFSDPKYRSCEDKFSCRVFCEHIEIKRILWTRKTKRRPIIWWHGQWFWNINMIIPHSMIRNR